MFIGFVEYIGFPQIGIVWIYIDTEPDSDMIYFAFLLYPKT